MLLAVCVVGTFSLGALGWMTADGALGGPYGVADALYRSYLAFAGGGIYLEMTWATSPPLWLARYLGPFTTVAAVVGAAYYLSREALRNAIARWRTDHHVLVGADPFALLLAEREARQYGARLTVLDTDERMPALAGLAEDRRTLLIGMPNDARATVAPLLGRRPRRITLGDADPVRNLDRARALGIHTRAREIGLRVEQASVSRDLDLLEPALRSARVFAAGETIARALVTEMDLDRMAALRRQPRAHVVMIGCGRIGVAIAREIGLRVRGRGGRRALLTIVDTAMDAARARIAIECPGLEDAVDTAYHDLDGMAVCTADCMEKLAGCESAAPITAVVVATGDDARNLGIAIRLRRVQRENLLLKAPLFVRNDSKACIGPDPLDSLSGGLALFGGRSPRMADAQIERFVDEMARDLHAMWLETQTGPEPAPWEALPTSLRRSNAQAAVSVIELLREAGLDPGPGDGIAGLRLLPRAAAAVLGDPSLLDRLSEREHARWMAERMTEGWRQAEDGLRDDERKRHALMIPYHRLDADAKAKDEQVVRRLLERCVARHRADPAQPAWRTRLRVGVIGPLGSQTAERCAQAWRELARWHPRMTGAPVTDCALEVLTPDAPGWDRAAATAILEGFKREAGRPARLIAFHAARRAGLDRAAEARVPRHVAEEQSAALARAAAPHAVSIDMRPAGVSDAQLAADPALFDRTVRAVADHIDGLCDVIVASMTDAGPETLRICDARRADGRSLVLVG
jgi:hypothetical protein